jgi:ribosomal protein S6
MTEENMKNESSSSRVYEVGYLMLPSIPEQKISEEVENIKSTIAKNGGSLIVEGAPELRTLAYEIEKHIGSRNERFDSAYFGWVKFEMGSEEVLVLEKFLDANPSIIRFLLIKTLRNAHIPPKPREMKPEVETDEEVLAPISSQEDIDKSIEELVA